MGHAIGPAAFDKTFIVVGAVRRGGVYKTCAGIIGHMIAVDHRHIISPKIIQLCKRVHTGCLGKLRACHVAQPRKRGHPGLAQTVFGQCIGKKIKITGRGPAFLFGGVNLIQPIGNLGVIGDGLVGWNGPRGCCPDHNPRSFKSLGGRFERKWHPDGV